MLLLCGLIHLGLQKESRVRESALGCCEEEELLLPKEREDPAAERRRRQHYPRRISVAHRAAMRGLRRRQWSEKTFRKKRHRVNHCRAAIGYAKSQFNPKSEPIIAQGESPLASVRVCGTRDVCGGRRPRAPD